MSLIHLQRAGEPIRIGRGHIHLAGVVHVDLDLRCFDDAADNLAARSDQVADLVGRDLPVS